MRTQPPTPTPAIPEHFDYREPARAAGIGETDLLAIVRLFETDYPHDLMLRELHILRACNAVRTGMVTVAQILRNAPPASSAA
ncbi:MAG TPA: hypothetical protein PKE29_18115 [Phycisphaerales bacterium]|nr:hypothetical protein [Phycisphaerales bacterium]